jgi:hypothetical protein
VRLRGVREVCHEHRDLATVILIEVWIDEIERRTRFYRSQSAVGNEPLTRKKKHNAICNCRKRKRS